MRIKVEDRQKYIDRAELIIKTIEQTRKDADEKVEAAFEKWYNKKWWFFKPSDDELTWDWAWRYCLAVYPSTRCSVQYNTLLQLVRVLKIQTNETVYLDQEDIECLQL